MADPPGIRRPDCGVAAAIVFSGEASRVFGVRLVSHIAFESE